MITVCDITINCYRGIRGLSNYRIVNSKHLITMHLDCTSPDWTNGQHASSIVQR